MLVVVQNSYKFDKKEPYGELLARLHGLFTQTGVEPKFHCTLSESLGLETGTAEARLFKRYPQLRPLWQTATIPGLVNLELAHFSATQDDLPFALLCEIANGIPRTYPFSIGNTWFSSPAFATDASLPENLRPGLQATLFAGPLGRRGAITATYTVDTPENSKAAAPPPPALVPLLALLGKPAKVNRLAPAAPPVDHAPLREILQSYRQRMTEISLEAQLPHHLPPLAEALATRHAESHPLKPALVARFGPLGFSCRGGSGVFELRRKTAQHHVVGLMLDVGTYSRMLSAQFQFFTPGFRGSLPLPIAPGLLPLQYPIGSPAQWEQLLDNLAALLTWLEPTLVKELESAVPPAPAWFEAPSS